MSEQPDNKWLETIEKLMRKAEDPATSQAERDAIVDKVTYLMTKFGIEQDMLRAADDKPLTAEHRKFVVPDPYALEKLYILAEVCGAFGCFVVNTMKEDNGKVSIFGTREDIERVYMLYGSIIIQLHSALGATVKPKHVHGRTFNGSFVKGFGYIVRKRIKTAALRAKEDIRNTSAGTGMELVLVNKAQVVKNMRDEIFPNLTTHYSRTSVTNGAAYAAGREAGSRADLGGSRISSQHSSRREIGN